MESPLPVNLNPTASVARQSPESSQPPMLDTPSSTPGVGLLGSSATGAVGTIENLVTLPLSEKVMSYVNKKANNPVVVVGGDIETEAFALLAGVDEADQDDANNKTLSIPLTRIPATIGRSHDTKDPHFFALGPKKAVSREQCRIFYQDKFGGMLELEKKSSDEFTYKPPTPTSKPKQVIRLNDDEPLPSQGFFSIECLGKNRITVGKKRVEQGEVAQIQSGTPIKISDYCLYFLLPTGIETKTIRLPSPVANKRAASLAVAAVPAKKKKASMTSDCKMSNLEKMALEDLLEELREAMDADIYERRHSYMGSIVALHAVKDVARAKEIRRIAKQEGGVPRQAILDWLEQSPKYSDWVKHTNNNVEFSTYQSIISKQLQNAGWERVGSTGRFVKWKPPDCDLESDDDDENASGDDDESEVIGDNSRENMSEEDGQENDVVDTKDSAGETSEDDEDSEEENHDEANHKDLDEDPSHDLDGSPSHDRDMEPHTIIQDNSVSTAAVSGPPASVPHQQPPGLTQNLVDSVAQGPEEEGNDEQG